MTLNSNYYNPIFKKYSVNKLSLASWGLSTLHAPQNRAEHLLTTDKTSPAARPGLLPPSCTLSSDFPHSLPPKDGGTSPRHASSCYSSLSHLGSSCPILSKWWLRVPATLEGGPLRGSPLTQLRASTAQES